MKSTMRSDHTYAYELPFGFWLTLEVTDEGLVQESLLSRERPSELPLLKLGTVKEVLDRYAMGLWEPEAIWHSIDKAGIPEPRLRVYKHLVGTHMGEVVSYGELARLAGVHARSVGTYMRTNWLPIFVPCHRVVSAKGIGGFSPDITWKITILDWERAAWRG